MRIHALAALAAASALVVHAPVARACGCLSSPMPPPDPPPGEVSYAVNQQSEQIIAFCIGKLNPLLAGDRG